MTAKRKLLVGLLAVATAVGTAWALARLQRARRRERRRQKTETLIHTEDVRERRRLLWELSKHLREGMTRDEVRHLLGPPDNADDTHVWMWETRGRGAAEGKRKWREIWNAGDCETFLLFDSNGRLLSRFLAKDDEPEESYWSLTDGRSLPSR